MTYGHRGGGQFLGKEQGGLVMTTQTLSQKRESGFKTNPDYKITFEPSPRRVRVKFNGQTVADSTNAHLLY
jgi:hypothetical protein